MTGSSKAKSFNVTHAVAENTSVNGTTTVTAEITNPDVSTATQPVELRYLGELVERKAVRIPSNGKTTVNFTVDVSTELLETEQTGYWAAFSVQTTEHGEPAFFYVENETPQNASVSSPWLP